MIGNNKINCCLSGRISRSGNRIGRQRNKNIVFQIPEDNIDSIDMDNQ